ncbi:MAG: alpha-amylase family glycosyl hydrolase [Lachnospiraceae bacterium]
MGYKIIEIDSLLKNYESDINLRMDSYKKKKKELLSNGQTLPEFANGYEYFGIHRIRGGWVYREWAPAADAMYLMGDFNDWNKTSHPMEKLDHGVFEITLKTKDLWHGCRVKAVVVNGDRVLERIPLYATRVEQDPQTYLWTGVVWHPKKNYQWKDEGFKAEKTPYIYECHIGMAQEKYGVGTYKEFKDNVLPRIKDLGYNAIQIMAVMEHPYYGSFGYQVSNFYAASSRFGKPEDLKELIDTAHQMGIQVLLDVVHSHAVKNTNEGINEFDGTVEQFFHTGKMGEHSAWDTKLFNYGKNEVLYFLLSNLKYWMTEYHFDGFRFDGVTSMIYHDHGLGISFDNYDKYFSMNTDIEALTYLTLANDLIHQMNKRAITIAEDMSGMPGMCIPIKDGGVGFDYRLSMGVPDLWIKMLKEVPDEDWDMWRLWYELTGRRPKEKVIGYAESHDQALVGDKTIMFRLCDQEMYWSMEKKAQNMIIDRGIALHKMIRLITLTLAGEGYLNFMGNEFGHPEWIDFPRQGNNWSYHYCRRQWSLVDNPDLKYEWLNNFDRAMIAMTKKEKTLTAENVHNLWVHQGDKVMVYEKGNDIYVMNFHPNRSFRGYFIPVTEPGEYKVILSTDEKQFGGQERVSKTYVYKTEELPDGRCGFLLYTPSRTAIVLKKMKGKSSKK